MFTLCFFNAMRMILQNTPLNFNSSPLKGWLEDYFLLDGMCSRVVLNFKGGGGGFICPSFQQKLLPAVQHEAVAAECLCQPAFQFCLFKNPLVLSAQVSWPLTDRVECEIGSQFLPALAVGRHRSSWGIVLQGDRGSAAQTAFSGQLGILPGFPPRACRHIISCSCACRNEFTGERWW